MIKLTQNKIEEIVLDVLGNEGIKLIKELKGKENVSEFSLATKLKKDIKLVRHMLYKLYNHNLVNSTRKKDKQKGWYIYYWTLVPENVKYLYLKNKERLLERYKEQLKREINEPFFTCAKRCVRLDFDQSLEFEFRCPECGELLNQDQDPHLIKKLEKEIEKLEKELHPEIFLNKKKEIKKEKKGPIKKKKEIKSTERKPKSKTEKK